MSEQVRRFATEEELASGVAEALLSRLVSLQQGGRVAQLCLTGGHIAHKVYVQLAHRVAGSELHPERLELWWGDERFVPTDDPVRNAGPTLAALAGLFPLDPARTHAMPSADGVADNDASAATYAKELADTVFDICLLGVGSDGHVASIFPGHPSFAPHQSHRVIGVSESPKPPSNRISITLDTINTSGEVWFLVVGAEKADAVLASWQGDAEVPAGVARGTDETIWFVDADAAAELPYHVCEL